MLGDTSRRYRRDRRAVHFELQNAGGDSGDSSSSSGGFSLGGLLGGLSSAGNSLLGLGSSSSALAPLGSGLAPVGNFAKTVATSSAQAIAAYIPIGRAVAIILGLIAIAGSIYLFKSDDINSALKEIVKTSAIAE